MRSFALGLFGLSIGCVLSACSGDTFVSANGTQDGGGNPADASGSGDANAVTEAGTSDASGGTVDPCPSIKSKRLMFVTNAAFLGNLGGISGANKTCNDAARAAALPGGYVAWIGTSAAPPMPPADTRVVVNVQQNICTQIAENASVLAQGGPQVPIDTDENGHAIQDSSCPVWTGVSSGATKLTCQDWTSKGAINFGSAGDCHKTDNQWQSANNQACSNTARLYCIQL